MDEIELIYGKKIPTDLLGELTIKADVLVYDYPRAFIAESKEKEYYAFLETEDRRKFFGWDVCKVDINQIREVNEGRKDMQSLFRGKELFYAWANDDSEHVSMMKVNEFTGDHAIEDSLFVQGFCDMDSAFGEEKQNG